jgi:hypothetical protein
MRRLQRQTILAYLPQASFLDPLPILSPLKQHAHPHRDEDE